MQAPIVEVGQVWVYEGRTYIIKNLTKIKWSDGLWWDAIRYVPTLPVEGAPNDYTRRTQDFVQKFYQPDTREQLDLAFRDLKTAFRRTWLGRAATATVEWLSARLP